MDVFLREADFYLVERKQHLNYPNAKEKDEQLKLLNIQLEVEDFMCLLEDKIS